jgi:hypothetical protein
MDRRVLITTVAGCILAAPPIGKAQQAGKVYRIGYLSPAAGPNPGDQAFERSLKDLGYVEGQNLRLECRYTEGRSDQLPEAAAELVRLRPDLIVVWSSAGSRMELRRHSGCQRCHPHHPGRLPGRGHRKGARCYSRSSSTGRELYRCHLRDDSGFRGRAGPSCAEALSFAISVTEALRPAKRHENRTALRSPRPGAARSSAYWSGQGRISV